MKLCFLLFGLLLVVPAPGQEHAHAPTLEQCKADGAVWGDSNAQLEYTEAQLAFLKNGTRNHTDVNKLSIRELRKRMSEMLDCTKEVPVTETTDYVNVVSFYQIIEGDRAYDFIERHGLHDRFLLEDRQGKR
jgi:hypothetical protein